MSEGKLQKLVIRCFKDERFQEELLDLKYTALLNPETYSFSLKPIIRKNRLKEPVVMIPNL